MATTHPTDSIPQVQDSDREFISKLTTCVEVHRRMVADDSADVVMRAHAITNLPILEKMLTEAIVESQLKIVSTLGKKR